MRLDHLLSREQGRPDGRPDSRSITERSVKEAGRLPKKSRKAESLSGEEHNGKRFSDLYRLQRLSGGFEAGMPLDSAKAVLAFARDPAALGV